MAVFTEVTPAQAQTLITQLGLGTVRQLQGCASGIENTNYFVSTERGDYVLTLFERLSAQQLPFYLQLMHHLASKAIAVPAPQADAQGHILHQLNGKPAAVVTRLPGANLLAPEPRHCAELGQTLARMHQAVQDFGWQQPNLRGLQWWQETAPIVRGHLNVGQQTMLDEELQFQIDVAKDPRHIGLPRGAVHADLFRDNAMFDGDHLSGVFDFYFAGCDTLIFDLAVCINDWCIDLASGAIDAPRAQALLGAYGSLRALTPDEQALLPAALRGAALRFWLSRLWDWHLPRDASMLKPHDPSHFERILSLRRMPGASDAWLAQASAL